jgi:hypothetical protein
MIERLSIFLTPPGTKILRILAPEGGTTRGSGEATPGLIRRDSLRTAVCQSWKVRSYSTYSATKD